MRTFNAPGLKDSKAKGLLDCHNCSIDYTRIPRLKHDRRLYACPSCQGCHSTLNRREMAMTLRQNRTPRSEADNFTKRNIMGKTKNNGEISQKIHNGELPAATATLPAPRAISRNADCAQATQPDVRSTLGYLFAFKRVLTNLITHFRLRIARNRTGKARIYDQSPERGMIRRPRGTVVSRVPG